VTAPKGAGPGSAATDLEARETVGIGNAAVSKAKSSEPQAVAFHPLADLFPLLEGVDFEELVADVRAYGVREPIVLYQGHILDGRNRYRATQAAGIECPTRVFDGADPVGFVISLNLKRRHLSESQRAMVAAKLANIRLGENQHTIGSANLPTHRAADLLNVSERTVRHAREVRESGAPELVRAVETGTVSVRAAADIASQPIDEQREIVARGEREILQAAAEIRARKMEVRRAERLARVAAQADAGPLPRGRKYPLVLADPPWRFQFSASSSRAVENHYETMSLEEICALPVAEIMTSIGVLFLVVPSAILEQAFEVIRRWGLTYKTDCVWDKTDGPGQGHYFRQQHETVLLAVRGDMPTPHENARPPSVFRAPRGEHSEKPDKLYEMIERMYPDLPKLELFARKRRPGWEVWGNEAPAAEPEDDLAIPGFLRRAP
jgi:N6-adenosine-specific RNA methylase IME4